MASVDLGLRLLLQDFASGGLGDFNSLLRGMIDLTTMGAGGFKDFSSAIAAQEAAAASAATKLETMGASFEALSAQSALANIELEASTKLLNNMGIMPDVQNMQTLLHTLEQEKQDLADANASLAIWQQALDASGGANVVAAANVAKYEAEVTRLEGSVQKTTDTIMAGDAATFEFAQSYDAIIQKSVDLDTKMTQLSQDMQTVAAAEQEAADKAVALSAAQDEAATNAAALTSGVAALVGGGIGLLGAALATKGLIDQGNTLADVMANLTVAFHLTGSDVDKMSASITAVASASRFTEQQVGDAFTALAEYGQSAAAVMGTDGSNGVGKAAIQLAEAIRSDTVPAAKLLSETMTQFSANADQAGYYASMLDYAFYHGIPDVNQMSTVLSDVGGKASKLNIPIDQLVATMDFLTRAGIKSSTAATSLRYILSSLVTPTAAAESALKDIGVLTINQTSPAFVKFKDDLDAAAAAAGATATPFDGTLKSLQAMFTQAQALHMPIATTDKNFRQWATSIGLVQNKLLDSKGNLKDWFTDIQTLGTAIEKLPNVDRIPAIQTLFNVRSGQDAQILLKNLDNVMAKLKGYDEQAKAFSQGGAGVKKDATTITSDLPGQLAKLNTTMSSFVAKVAQPLENVLAGIAGHFNDLASLLSGLDPRVQAGTYTFLGLWSALSLVAVVFGIVQIAALPFLAAIAPIVGTVALIAVGAFAVAAAAGLIVANWGRIGPIFSSVATAVLSVIAGLVGLGVLVGISIGIGLLGAAIQGGLIPAFIAWAARTLFQIGLQGALVLAILTRTIPAILMQVGPLMLTAGLWALQALPIILLIGLFAALVVGLMLVINHFGGLAMILRLGQALWTSMLKVFQQIGAEISQQFAQALKQLQPQWNQLVQSFNQARPMLMALGMALGVIVAVVLALGVAILNGLIHTIVPAVGMVIGVVAGIMKAFLGLAQFFVGFWLVLQGLFTLNWGMVGHGFQLMGSGILAIITGLGSSILSIFVGVFRMVLGFVSGFIGGIIGFFQHLFMVLVGNSIVPDMLRAILMWFINIPNQILGVIGGWVGGLIGQFARMGSLALSAVVALWSMVSGAFHNGASNILSIIQSLPGLIVGALAGLGSMLFSSGVNAINMLANGIRATIGNITSAVTSVASAISNVIGFHSPPKEGILADSDSYMPNMMKMLGRGIIDNQHHVTGAVNTVATSINKGFTTPLTQAQGGGFGPSVGGVGASATTIQFLLDSKVVGQAVLDQATGQLRMSGLTRRMR